MEWEQIDDYTSRVRVFGGWLVRHDTSVTHNMMGEGRGMEDGWDWRSSITFVPDFFRLWRLKKKEA